MRLDVYLCDSGLSSSRTEAKELILGGMVTVNGSVAKKPSLSVAAGDEIKIIGELRKYVSRGGLKLEGAIDFFGLSVEGALALDVGASSGGFTDCLLKHGAAHVIAVDSGSGQLAESLRRDSRVTVVENYNARAMRAVDLEYRPSLAVMDVSFISSTLIIPAVYNCLAEGGEFILLVKPQFEVGRSGVGKGGIVKDEKLRKKALADVISFASSCGFSVIGSTTSPIEGGDGNIEYLVRFRKER
ncbi:MAG: TlyA family RNA methyltransferase [Clostridia bacterium]|nr:TlyA family RNA methyltransferase [Clostridia bacterium]